MGAVVLAKLLGLKHNISGIVQHILCRLFLIEAFRVHFIHFLFSAFNLVCIHIQAEAHRNRIINRRLYLVKMCSAGGCKGLCLNDPSDLIDLSHQPRIRFCNINRRTLTYGIASLVADSLPIFAVAFPGIIVTSLRPGVIAYQNLDVNLKVFLQHSSCCRIDGGIQRDFPLSGLDFQQVLLHRLAVGGIRRIHSAHIGPIIRQIIVDDKGVQRGGLIDRLVQHHLHLIGGAHMSVLHNIAVGVRVINAHSRLTGVQPYRAFRLEQQQFPGGIGHIAGVVLPIPVIIFGKGPRVVLLIRGFLRFVPEALLLALLLKSMAVLICYRKAIVPVRNARQVARLCKGTVVPNGIAAVGIVNGDINLRNRSFIPFIRLIHHFAVRRVVHACADLKVHHRSTGEIARRMRAVDIRIITVKSRGFGCGNRKHNHLPLMAQVTFLPRLGRVVNKLNAPPLLSQRFLAQLLELFRFRVVVFHAEIVKVIIAVTIIVLHIPFCRARIAHGIGQVEGHRHLCMVHRPNLPIILRRGRLILDFRAVPNIVGIVKALPGTAAVLPRLRPVRRSIVGNRKPRRACPDLQGVHHPDVRDILLQIVIVVCEPPVLVEILLGVTQDCLVL